MRKVTGLQFHIDDNLPARLVYDIVALATRNDFVPVIRQELIQICQRILQIGRLIFLGLLVMTVAPMKSRGSRAERMTFFSVGVPLN